MEVFVLIGLVGVFVYWLTSRGGKPRAGKGSRVQTAAADTLRYDGPTGSGISLSLDGSTLSLWEKGKRKTYDAADIMSAEIIRDDTVIYDTSKMGGAALGGALLLGPIGALAGLGGKASSSKSIKELAIKIYVKDLERPYHKITFLRAPKGLRTDHRLARAAAHAVEEWNGRLAIIMAQRAA